MPQDLRDVTRAFGRGEATLETWRRAALGETSDRHLAGEILRLIAEWESSPLKDTVRYRNEMRARAKKLAPAPSAEPSTSRSRAEPGESLYAAGLRGQRRRD